MITETTYRGRPALQLADATVRLTVLPGWGGKTTEILAWFRIPKSQIDTLHFVSEIFLAKIGSE